MRFAERDGEVHGDEGAGGARRVLVDGARDEILARPGFPHDEDGYVARGSPADDLPHVEHRGARTDQRVPGRRRRRRGARVAERLRLDRALDGVEERRKVERLRDVLECARLHRRDGALAIAVRGRHDDGNLGASAPDLTEEIEAVAVGKPDVEEHAVDRIAAKNRPRFGERPGDDRLVTLRSDRPREPVADAGFVVDDEDVTHRDTLRLGERERELRHPAAPRVPQAASVGLGDRAREREPEPSAARLGGEERLEEQRDVLLRDPGARVADRDRARSSRSPTRTP